MIADRTAPAVSIVLVDPPTVGVDGTSTVTWHGDESGGFTVLVGGSDCSSGREVASGSYSASEDTAAEVDAASLSEGPNNVFVCVTDSAGNVGSAQAVITKDTSTTA